MLCVLDVPFPTISVRPNMPDVARLTDELTDRMQLCDGAVDRPLMTTAEPSVVRVCAGGEALAAMTARVRRGMLERAAPPDGATPLVPYVNCLVCRVARAGPYMRLLFGAHWAHAARPAKRPRIRD
jgi:hypothetical protein